MATNEESRQLGLYASYLAVKESHNFSHPLPPLPPEFSTKEKTQYLSTLRSTVAEMQKEINVFLTTKMEEDNAQMAAKGTKVDDTMEEANYGEELVDEEG